MKINIYYGGRGLIEDPTIYVINKLIEVFKELRVDVTRYNLYEEKQGISMLPKTMKEADGIILATTVEWFGIGGYMQQFLDACWLYADKEKMKTLFMLPVVTASTLGERDAEFALIKAWEMLGGIPCEGICAYVDDHVEFETNPEYAVMIEKIAETQYRTINQRRKQFPTSFNAVKQNILKSATLDLTPQESEQLSVYVSDDTYVKKQKEDIEELTQIFKDMLGQKGEEKDKEFIKNLKEKFKPLDNFSATYSITFTDTNKTLNIEVDNLGLKCYYGENETADVTAKTSLAIMRSIVNGRMTFQRAFMTGDLVAKGNFKNLRTFDTVFQFSNLI